AIKQHFVRRQRRFIWVGRVFERPCPPCATNDRIPACAGSTVVFLYPGDHPPMGGAGSLGNDTRARDAEQSAGRWHQSTPLRRLDHGSSPKKGSAGGPPTGQQCLREGHARFVAQRSNEVTNHGGEHEQDERLEVQDGVVDHVLLFLSVDHALLFLSASRFGFLYPCWKKR